MTSEDTDDKNSCHRPCNIVKHEEHLFGYGYFILFRITENTIHIIEILF